ncbi:MAG: hypothetical protein QGG64_06465, partial [Candidatus Latescibacteria bacterium]|nr:hypothetical protein [Candidatus Latescibacterota bacterium]
MQNNVFGLTCNHTTKPLGIDSIPTFSWKYSFQEGYQRAYRICVSANNLSDETYVCWDSGTVDSDQSN